jgi:hypothetical protein
MIMLKMYSKYYSMNAKMKFNFKKKKVISKVLSHQKWGKKSNFFQIHIYIYIYICFSSYSQTYRKMIKDLYFISGL